MTTMSALYTTTGTSIAHALKNALTLHGFTLKDKTTRGTPLDRRTCRKDPAHVVTWTYLTGRVVESEVGFERSRAKSSREVRGVIGEVPLVGKPREQCIEEVSRKLWCSLDVMCYLSSTRGFGRNLKVKCREISNTQIKKWQKPWPRVKQREAVRSEKPPQHLTLAHAFVDSPFSLALSAFLRDVFYEPHCATLDAMLSRGSLGHGMIWWRSDASFFSVCLQFRNAA